MHYYYGTTQTGKAHAKTETVCQDAHKIEDLKNGIVVAAVADGLGSESHSDMASKMAVDVAVEYIAGKLGALTEGEGLPENVTDIIREAFHLAQDRIEAEAAEQEIEFTQCDTTLSLAVFSGGELYYGHSGDSGIIALTDDGRYVPVTEQQRDDIGRVFPLFFRERQWVFGKVEKKVASVLLATDGILEPFSPLYIKDQDPNLHISLLRYFMEIGAPEFEARGQEAICTDRAAYIESIPEEIVDDDITLVALIDTAVPVTPQPPEYYAEPDWDALRTAWREEYRKIAYPGLTDAAPEAEPEAETAAAEALPEAAATDAAPGPEATTAAPEPETAGGN